MTMPHRTRSLAAAVAATVLVPAGAVAATGMSANAATTPRAVKIAPSAAPKQIDKPGKANDVVRITNIPGVRWTVTGIAGGDWTSQSTAERYADLKVDPAGSGVVTVSASTADGYTLQSEVQGWTLTYNLQDVPADALVAPVSLDKPGVNNDVLVITGVPGVTWQATAAGAATPVDVTPIGKSRTVPIAKTFGSTAGEVSVTATPAPGYTWPATPPATTSWTLKTTTDAVAPIDAAAIDQAVQMGVDLAGRTRDTVSIDPVNGVTWSVCGSRDFTVSRSTYRSAACGGPDQKVTVRAKAIPGYTFVNPSGASGVTLASDSTTVTKVIDFPDSVTAGQKTVTVTADDVKPVDGDGYTQDVVKLTYRPGMTWLVAPAPAKPEQALRWSKAPRPSGRDTEGIVKIKAGRNATSTDVYVRPVPADEDWIVSGWTGDGSRTDFPDAEKITFGSQPVDLLPTILDQVTFGSTAAGTTVKLPGAVPGVLSWLVTRTATVGTTARELKTTVKVDPYTDVTVQLETDATNVKVAPVSDKDHNAGTLAKTPSAP